MSNPKLTYRRILLKLSGEALGGKQGFGINSDTLSSVCDEIADIRSLGVGVAIVIGGGNFFRGLGASAEGFERVSADYIGMLATVMNAIALQQALSKAGMEARVQSAIPISPVAEPYVRQRAIKHLDAGRVVIFAAGTGNPYFTTDTAASLRAAEINADILVKATKVDGVYDCDPSTNPKAKRYVEVSFDQVLQKRLAIMDAAAIVLCRDNNTCLRVMSLTESGNLRAMVLGEPIGTLVFNEISS
jgi:uridylate kinase